MELTQLIGKQAGSRKSQSPYSLKKDRTRSVSDNRSALTANNTGSGTAVDFLVHPDDDNYIQKYANVPPPFHLGQNSSGSKIHIDQSNLSNSFNKIEL